MPFNISISCTASAAQFHLEMLENIGFIELPYIALPLCSRIRPRRVYARSQTAFVYLGSAKKIFAKITDGREVLDTSIHIYFVDVRNAFIAH